MRSDEVIAALSRFIADTMERKARWLLIVVGLGVIGIVFAHGLTWTSAIVGLIALIVIPFAWLMLSFWSSFFRNLGRSGEQR
jgi:hypothetical protein